MTAALAFLLLMPQAVYITTYYGHRNRKFQCKSLANQISSYDHHNI